MPVKPDVLDEWLKPQCSRLMYGRCTTLYCLRRGGYTGEPADASIATCEAYEAYNALSQQNGAASSVRDKCVDAIKSLRATPRGAAYNNAVNDAIRKCESLTLDPLEPEKQK